VIDTRFTRPQRCRFALSTQPFDSLDWLPILNEHGQGTGYITILALILIVIDEHLVLIGRQLDVSAGRGELGQLLL